MMVYKYFSSVLFGRLLLYISSSISHEKDKTQNHIEEKIFIHCIKIVFESTLDITNMHRHQQSN